MHHATARRQQGGTLIEACIALAIAATALGLAKPTVQRTRDLRRLEGAAAQLEPALRYTRSLAVARSEILRFAFVGSSCFVVHSGGPTDCTCADDGGAQCTGNPAVCRVVRLGSVGIRSNSA
jgi:type IV fimbrial biogenesis protein FimT